MAFGLGALRSIAAISPAAWYNIGLMTALLSLAFAGFLAVRAWREMHEDIEPASVEELLESFERARAEGALDDQEYRRVRRKVEGTGSESASAPGTDQ